MIDCIGRAFIFFWTSLLCQFFLSGDQKWIGLIESIKVPKNAILNKNVGAWLISFRVFHVHVCVIYLLDIIWDRIKVTVSIEYHSPTEQRVLEGGICD